MRRLAFILLAACAHTSPTVEKPLATTGEMPAGPACGDGKACFAAGADAYKAQDYTTSFAAFSSACDQGYAFGCGAIAEHYRLGRGVDKDEPHALQLYEQACNGGASNSCVEAGIMLREGTGVAPDVAQSIVWIQKGCDLNHPNACAEIGQRRETGNGMPKDLGQAIVFYKKGCDLGYANACHNLGLMYHTGEGTSVDDVQARAYVQRACDLKSDTACQAVETLFSPAKLCAGGDLDACNDQAWALANGDPKDEKGALALYEKSCAGGNQDGCVFVGMNTDDRERARKLFDAACNQGVLFGCRELGFYYHDEADPPDLARARSLFERACPADDPDPDACGALGEYFYNASDDRQGVVISERGCGVDSADACDWAGVFHQHLSEWDASLTGYAKGCALGNAHACGQGEFLLTQVDEVTHDPARAALFKACGAGDKAKCDQLLGR